MDNQNHNNNHIERDQEMKQRNNNQQKRVIKPGSPNRLKRHRVRHPHFTSFKTKYPILLRALHPTLKMSFRLVTVFDSVVNHLYHRIVNEAKELAYSRKRHIILQRDIKTACRLIFPPELFIHVEREANKSILRYDATC